jgi:nucleotide-binding universal stress UspA family protein
MSGIVVGVDGSAGSLDALRVAIAEARLRGSTLTAVGVWHVGPIEYQSTWAGVPIDRPTYQAAAEEMVGKALEEVGVAESGLSVSMVVREGQPADVLCDEAQGAVFLVVGSRGFGGFRGLLLGSVSQACAQHAPCPVLIVPGRTRDAEDEPPTREAN